MDELESLRSSASRLLSKAQEGSSLADLATAVEKATTVQRLEADLEASRATLRRAELEEAKLRYENETAAARERAERLRDYVSLLAPFIAILSLVATLAFQNYQFVQSEKDKNDAASDAQWQEAVRTITEARKLPPDLVTLRPFLTSQRHKDEARVLAVQLATISTDPSYFDELTGMAFVPANWSTLDYLLKIDKALVSKQVPLIAKGWDEKKQTNVVKKLSPYEQTVWQYIVDALPKLTVQIGSVLKTARPDNLELDLSNAWFVNSDLSGIDLSGAVIENTRFQSIDLKDANLSRITRFSGANFDYTEWWEAASINGDLLEYLQSRYPCDPEAKFSYGSKGERVTKDQCDADIGRLRKKNGS